MKKIVIALMIGVLFVPFLGAKSLHEVLTSKDEALLLLAIREGEDAEKASCIEALSGRTASAETIALVTRYVGYGVTYTGGKGAGMFDDSTWQVRRSAALALASWKSADSVIPLTSVLMQERNNIVKNAIIYALGEIGDERGVSAILNELRFTRMPTMQMVSIEALGKIGNRRAFIDLLAIAQDRKYPEQIRQAAVEALDKIKW